MKYLKSVLMGCYIVGSSSTFGSSLDHLQPSEAEFYSDTLTSSDFGSNSNNLDSSRCFCQGGCFYGSGDSYHYRKVVDVNCNLPLKEKVVKALMSHYIDSHGIENIPQILDNVSIKCFESSTR